MENQQNNANTMASAAGTGTIKKRFLVIGEAGVGKTFTTNTLSGTNHVVSDSAIGVTFSFQKGHRLCVIQGDGNSTLTIDVELIDTIGLSEGDAGKVHPAVAFAKLVAFVKDSEDGFHGIILVIGSPRVSKSMQENYRLFVEAVTDHQVPCYLFINKQELEDYSTQYERNKNLYTKSGFKFEYGFAGGWKLPDARQHTLQQFEKCFAEAPAEAKPLYKAEGFFKYIQRVWRDIVKSFHLILFGVTLEDPEEEDSLVGIFKKLGVPDKVAREIAYNFEANGYLFTDSEIDKLAEKLKAQKRAKGKVE